MYLEKLCVNLEILTCILIADRKRGGGGWCKSTSLMDLSREWKFITKTYPYFYLQPSAPQVVWMVEFVLWADSNVNALRDSSVKDVSTGTICETQRRECQTLKEVKNWTFLFTLIKSFVRKRDKTVYRFSISCFIAEYFHILYFVVT